MTAREPSSLRLVGSLSVIGLLSGLILVGVYLGTLPRIQRNRAEALRTAVFLVLPGTESIATWVLREERLVPYDGPEGVLPEEPAVYAGTDAGGRLVGYAIPADGAGFMDTIKLLYGFNLSRRSIVGMQVLESRETPGLGDKIASDEAFLASFVALSVDPTIVPVKSGARAEPNQVDCITGATISSEAVVTILNRSAERWIPLLEQIEISRVSRNDGH